MWYLRLISRAAKIRSQHSPSPRVLMKCLIPAAAAAAPTEGAGPAALPFSLLGQAEPVMRAEPSCWSLPHPGQEPSFQVISYWISAVQLAPALGLTRDILLILESSSLPLQCLPEKIPSFTGILVTWEKSPNRGRPCLFFQVVVPSQMHRRNNYFFV